MEGHKPDQHIGTTNPAVILLIEDEEMLRSLLERFLVSQGFVVLAAANGLDGLEVFKRRRNDISVVLTDVHLPGMDGCAAFLEMRRIDPTVKAIFTSGHMDHAMKKKLQEEGVHHFIHKPFLIQEVLDAVYEAIGAT